MIGDKKWWHQIGDKFTFINGAFVELLLILNFIYVDNIIVWAFETDIIIDVDI